MNQPKVGVVFHVLIRHHTVEHTMERKAIEKFLNEIDEDIVAYAPFFT